MPRHGSDLLRSQFSVLCLVAVGFGCGDDSTPGGTSVGSTTGATDSSSTTATTGGTQVLDDTGTSQESSSDEGEPVVCPDTHECVPVPPDGWEGPVAFLQTEADDEEPSCDSSYPDQAAVVHHGLIEPPPACDCACGEATDVTCQLPIVARFWGDDATCSRNVPAQYELYSGVCNVLPAALPPETYWTAAPVSVSGGTCEAIATAEVTPARFEKRVTICGGGESLDGCSASQLCVPQPSDLLDASVCVWQSGEHACPMGYADRQLLFGDVEDDRACGECSCTEPVGLCDDASLALFGAMAACNPPSSGTVLANGQCHATNALETRSVVVAPGQPSAFCAPSEGPATGSATPTDPLTLCCR